MLSTLSSALSGQPRRTLLIVLAFLVVAGVIGGPVAGALKSSGGFVPPNSPSQLALTKIEAATGRQISPGIVLAVATPRGPAAAGARIANLGRRLAQVPGVVAVRAPAATARDGRHVLITGTFTRPATMA